MTGTIHRSGRAGSSVSVSRVLAAVALALLAAPVLGACVSREHAEHERVRKAYQACVDEKGASHTECRALRAELDEVQTRYEARAKKAWNCETSPEECPRPR